MAYPLQLLSREPLKAASSQGPMGGPPVTVDWRSAQDDLDLARTASANLLLIGPDWLVTDVIRRFIADVPHRIIVLPRDARWFSPLPLPPSGTTLVLRDLHELDRDGQAALLEWLDHSNGEHQIVCTGSAALPALLDSGKFDPRLYYRLNIVCINLYTS